MKWKTSLPERLLAVTTLSHSHEETTGKRDKIHGTGGCLLHSVVGGGCYINKYLRLPLGKVAESGTNKIRAFFASHCTSFFLNNMGPKNETGFQLNGTILHVSSV